MQIHSAIEPISIGCPCVVHSPFSATRAEPNSWNRSCAPQLRTSSLALYRQSASPWPKSEGHQEQSETKIWHHIEILGRNKRKLASGLKEDFNTIVWTSLFLKWSSLPPSGKSSQITFCVCHCLQTRKKGRQSFTKTLWSIFILLNFSLQCPWVMIGFKSYLLILTKCKRLPDMKRWKEWPFPLKEYTGHVKESYIRKQLRDGLCHREACLRYNDSTWEAHGSIHKGFARWEKAMSNYTHGDFAVR